MIRQLAPWLLSAIPLLGAISTLACWARPRQVKQVAASVALATFVVAIGLSMALAFAPHSILLICLLPLAAFVSILGQPVEPEHRPAWALTLVFLNLGLVALTGEGMMKTLSLVLLLGGSTALLYRHHSALWPISWIGITSLACGTAAAVVSAMIDQESAAAVSLILWATLLPLVPFHTGYFMALTRLPGNLPSFVVVLFPVLGLHGLVPALSSAPSVVSTTVIGLALFGTLHGAGKALVQSRPRSLLAYGSLSFFSIMWWFAATMQASVPAASVFVGAVSLGTSGLLIAWQAVRTRYGDDVDPTAISGLASTMPRYAVLLSLLALAIMGLPPFGVYTGFLGLALSSPLTSIAALAIVLLAWLMSSWYVLDAAQRLLFGRQRTELRYRDLVPFEYAALLIVITAILALGVVPPDWFTPSESQTVTHSTMEWPAWNR